MEKEEYSILNVLRGVSAFMVVFYHFCVFFFAHPPTSAGYLKIEPIYLPDPFYVKAIQESSVHMQPLVVCSFFLISGFLILPSLERYASFTTYLVHKWLRLWPTYAICFGTGLLFVAAFCALQDRPFPYSVEHMLTCFSWTRDIFDDPLIDGSVWTLEIQIKFYLLVGILWYGGQKYFLEKLCFSLLALGLLAYGVCAFDDGIMWPLPTWLKLGMLVSKNVQIMTYIALGTCLYTLHKKRISWQRASCLIGVLLLSFVSPLYNYVSYTPGKMTAYLLGFSVFAGLFFFDRHVFRLSPKGLVGKVINWLSRISYPLYVGHMLAGYIILFYTAEQGVNIWWGIAVAYIYSFLMAIFIHKKVEIPCLRFSKYLISVQNEKP